MLPSPLLSPLSLPSAPSSATGSSVLAFLAPSDEPCSSSSASLFIVGYAGQNPWRECQSDVLRRSRFITTPSSPSSPKILSRILHIIEAKKFTLADPCILFLDLIMSVALLLINRGDEGLTATIQYCELGRSFESNGASLWCMKRPKAPMEHTRRATRQRKLLLDWLKARIDLGVRHSRGAVHATRDWRENLARDYGHVPRRHVCVKHRNSAGAHAWLL